MGTRANVYVHEGDKPGVWLYQHYDGYDLPKTVAAALRRGQSRWLDSSYLTRIIFSEMIKDDVDGTTGYGIDAAVTDGANRVVDVDVEAQMVKLSRQLVIDNHYADSFEDGKTFGEFSLLGS